LSSLDIGIDLGTCTIIAGTQQRGVVVREPSVMAVNAKTDEVIDIGESVYHMIGRTPDTIRIVRPVEDGVVSNFKMTETLMWHLIGKVSRNHLIKPRVIVCVPSVISGVESQAVIDAAAYAGARQVYLIEEPVAAAIGAGIDLSKPQGNLIVDIGGGTSDVAVLSLGGVVCKNSTRVAGRTFDNEIIRHMRSRHNLLIGEKTAEAVKIEIGEVFQSHRDQAMDVKGRNLVTGLPTRVALHSDELYPEMHEIALQIAAGVQNVLERTPPELVGDIKQNGIILTGGGALIGGFAPLLEERIGVTVRIAENAVDSVVLGTIQSFRYLGTLFDGFVRTSTHTH
jgi:rod shape-determining protein MreB